MAAKIDLVINPDRLSKYFENLTLENGLPAEDENNLNHTDSLIILEKLREDKETTDPEKNDSLKHESSDESINENISCFQQVRENDAISFKNDNKDELHLIKSEVVSDEENEETTSLIERGGPDRNKKRNKKKIYDKSSISNADLDRQKLKFLSAGQIIENNIVNFPIHHNSVQRAISNSDELILNIPIKNKEHNLSLSRQISTDTIQGNNLRDALSIQYQIQQPVPSSDSEIAYFSASSPEIGSINSPESGYDTSQSSGVYSPSPPLTGLQLLNEELEKRIEIEAIVHSLRKSVRDYENSSTKLNSSNSSDQNVKCEKFIENISTLHTLPGISTGDLGHKVIDVTNSHNNISPTQCQQQTVNIPFTFNELESEIQFENFEGIDDLINNINLQDVPSQAPFAAAISTQDNENEFIKTSKERKISMKLREVYKHHLRYSEFFVEDNYYKEEETLLRNIHLKQKNEEFNVIDIVKDKENESLNQTNLQMAVIEQNIEKIYALVEAHKKFCSSLSLWINHPDNSKKTALDYAIQMNMTLVVNYLIENLAVKGLSIKEK